MRVIIIMFFIVVLAIGALGVVIAFNAPKPPPVMVSVVHALDHVDFSDLPAVSHYAARDDTELAYRAYPGSSQATVILVHGSSGNSASMHALARALQSAGATVYALSMRGHDHTGRSGDIDYIGQMDDDLADFVATLGNRREGERRILLGFSSGGGFVLRIAGSKYGNPFDRFVLLAPFLRYDAPTVRPGGGGWTSVAVGRMIGLTLLNKLGISALNGLPVIAFAVAPDMRDVQTPSYSYRLLRNFGPHDDYLGDLVHAPAPVVLLDGDKDEIFRHEEFAPLLHPVCPGLVVTIVPDANHMGLISRPDALQAATHAALGAGGSC